MREFLLSFPVTYCIIKRCVVLFNISFYTLRSVPRTNEMFKVGFAGYLDVLSADERFLDCELERIALNVESCKLHIMLYRALGGGSN